MSRNTRPFLIGVVVMFGATAILHAATYTVTTTADSGIGSLRDALSAAQSGACAAPCRILFNIAGSPSPSGVFTIRPLSAYNSFSDAIIDGATQTAFSGDHNPAGPEVVINGGLCVGTCNGLVGRERVEIRNLVINGFSGAGVVISSDQRTDSIVAGNYLGTDETGMNAVPNVNGVELGAAYVRVGDGNLISGNSNAGVHSFKNLSNSVAFDQIVGNRIGTNREGNAPLPNGVGVLLDGGSIANQSMTIGTLAPGEGNIIAFNSGAGVLLRKACETSIRGNSIYSNGDLGISILNNNTCAPPPRPAILSMNYEEQSNVTGIALQVPGRQNHSVMFDFYANQSPDPSGYGEGAAYIGSASLITDADGKANATLTGDLRAMNLTATANTVNPANGSTTSSDFSNVGNSGPHADLAITLVDVNGGTSYSGQTVAFRITVSNNGPEAARGLRVVDQFPSSVQWSPSLTGNWFCKVDNPSSSLVICDYTAGDLAPGASDSFELRAPAPSPGTVVDTATVSAASIDTALGNNTATASTNVVENAALELTQSDTPDPAPVGSVITYRLSLRNNGPAAAHDVRIVDTLPPEVTFVDAVPNQPGWSCSRAGEIVVCECASVAAISVAEVRLRVTAPNTVGVLSNRASVSSATSDSNSADNASTETTSVVSCEAPLLLTPAEGARLTDKTVRLSWTMPEGASDFHVWRIVDGRAILIGNTIAGDLTAAFGSGPVVWYVEASFPNGCPTASSHRGAFSVIEPRRRSVGH